MCLRKLVYYGRGGGGGGGVITIKAEHRSEVPL